MLGKETARFKAGRQRNMGEKPGAAL